MLARETDQTDLRARTVKRLADKFEADAPQAQRVEKVACSLLNHLIASNPTPAHPSTLQDSAQHLKKLAWAAQLHEVGSQISHSEYHKHGAYILQFADAPGFATHEMQRLSLLVLGHRGKLRKLEADLEDEVFIRQLLCLRLSALLCHARRDPDLAGFTLQQQGRQFTLRCTSTWAAQFPQSVYLLREEVSAWQKTVWTLDVQVG
jgi:exopolyphosphatase/guanosine-5'-triphosphate,3'-diphosphate pyrophosphatase